jgi:hypothetical protein
MKGKGANYRAIMDVQDSIKKFGEWCHNNKMRYEWFQKRCTNCVCARQEYRKGINDETAIQLFTNFWSTLIRENRSKELCMHTCT